MFASKRCVFEGEWVYLCGTTRKAAATCEAGEPCLARSLLTKAARPGIVVVEDCQAVGRLMAKNVCLCLCIILHPVISVEVVWIDIGHHGYLGTDVVWCESF